MKTPIWASRSFLAAAAVLLGLLSTSGQITATSTVPDTAAQPSIGADAALAARQVRSETVIRPSDRPDVFVRAGDVRDGLGLPVGAGRTAKHVVDGFQAGEYDEVVEADAGGQPMSLTQFDNAGRLLVAVRFDLPSATGIRTTRDAALGSARRGLVAAGLTVSGEPAVDAGASGDGWDVRWARVNDGFAVRGDEIRVRVRADGRIASVARVEHRLASVPAKIIDRTAASRIATRQLTEWSTGNQAGYALAGMEIEWVGPNAAFDPTKLASVQGPYRLAWVAKVKPTGKTADYMGLVTLFLDAGDGSLVGGDFVE